MSGSQWPALDTTENTGYCGGRSGMAGKVAAHGGLCRHGVAPTLFRSAGGTDINREVLDVQENHDAGRSCPPRSAPEGACHVSGSGYPLQDPRLLRWRHDRGPRADSPDTQEFTAKLQRFAADQAAAHGIETAAKTCISHDPSADLEETLMKAIEEIGADLVVTGSHVPGLADRIFASHSGYLAAHTNVSVFIVR